MNNKKFDEIKKCFEKDLVDITDINLLNDKIMIFYLDEPIPLEIEPEQSQSHNSDEISI